MAYTPELRQIHSCTLRRIAWALDIPMTKAMDAIFEYIGNIIDRKLVCKGCRDKLRCEDCVFNIS